MKSFSFNGNPLMGDKEFEEFISNDKNLRQARYPFGYQKGSKTATGYYINYSFNDVRDITDDQRETARKRYEERRAEIRKEFEKEGTLFIITMGGDFRTSDPDGIGNHRVRVRWHDQNGDLRGCEFMPSGNGFTFDRWNTSEEERKNTAYLKALKDLETKYGERHIPVNEMPEFPCTYADRGVVSDLPFTTHGLIEWLHREHGANFSRAYIDRYFFACDEITSESEK